MRIQLKHPGPAIVCALLIAGPILNGCAGAKAGPRPDGLEPGGTVIRQGDIAEMNVRTALEVVERGARHLLIQRTREGTPVRIYHRGVDSIYLDAEVQVVVDGVPMNYGIQALKNIPSASIDFIQILSAREGTTKYGANAGAGVIVVKTNAG
jgi:outer membrane cobalamin receptor